MLKRTADSATSPEGWLRVEPERTGLAIGPYTPVREEPWAWACWLLALVALLAPPLAVAPALLSVGCGGLTLRRLGAGWGAPADTAPSRELARVGITAALIALALWLGAVAVALNGLVPLPAIVWVLMGGA